LTTAGDAIPVPCTGKRKDIRNGKVTSSNQVEKEWLDEIRIEDLGEVIDGKEDGFQVDGRRQEVVRFEIEWRQEGDVVPRHSAVIGIEEFVPLEQVILQERRQVVRRDLEFHNA
jgi:hypothetical protein